MGRGRAGRRFSFKWGPATTLRLATFVSPKGRHITELGVHTDHHDIEVLVSGKGRRVRVYQDGRRLR